MRMQHLLVDGLATNLYLLRHEADLCAYLRHLVDLLGMHLMAEPLSVQATGFGPEAGVTAVAIISESHIVLHSWVERTDFNFNFDMFSCKSFDEQVVLASLIQRLQVKRYAYRILVRPLTD